MKKINELKAQLREKRDRLGELAQVRELNDEQKAEMLKLKREVENIKDELDCEIRELQIAQLQAPAQHKSKNAELREFLRDAKKGSVFSIPMNRESMSYGAQSGGYQGTEGYVQGIEVKELIDTERKDADILAAAGVPMTTGVVGNKIQWAFAGGVEAVFANELAHTTERTISLDKQSPVQNRLTLRVRFSNQMLENSNFDLQGYIVKHVSDAIRDKINWAAASTTKATETLYGGFAQDTESGTYGQEGYVPGKQAGTYSTFSKETAAEMIAKIAKRNLKLNNCLFVMAIASLESANGTMCFKPNNMFGFGSRGFSSKSECVDVVARSLEYNYLTPGGSLYNGTRITDVNKRYAASSTWDNKVCRNMARYYATIAPAHNAQLEKLQ